ncbi:cleft lip and palate associated transmembrane protein 1 [Trichodelitschia bisporula]|uniref:Cleft lip and palate associated transmembrane protein 1 n=1 Tax=Trichodelitschia bisporula TaxID=703511 RepID=A0A6G1HQW6_9PEZI|nr:cleft lip and palate associated transmembrane protein 1 [Trichodelitschia bisporula]
MPEARPQQRNAQETQGGGASGVIRSLVQSVGIFILIQFAMKQFMPQNAADSTGASGSVPAFTDRPDASGAEVAYSAIPQTIAPMWPAGTPLDVRVYVSPSLVIPSLRALPAESLVLKEDGFVFGDYKDKREADKTFPISREVQNKGTLWAHFLVAQSGSPLDPTASNYDGSKAYHFTRPLTQQRLKKKVAKTRNLLADDSEDVKEEAIAGPTMASYYHPNFTLSFIPDSGVQNYPSMHPAVRQFVQLEGSGSRDATGKNGWYYPILYVNTFWQLRNHMTELNETVKELPIHITLNNFANWKFGIMASIDEGMKANAQKVAEGQSVPGGDGSEFEDFKRILLDSNPYLLGTTFFVSILHMIFEMLAFKSDVSHWRKKKDNVGTSLRTILANVVMQLIIFLYLFDNNENTSWMILFGQGMGIAIEAWKITKTVNVRVRPTAPGSWLPYNITFEDKHKLSETEKKTEEYDQIAFKYLYMVAVPLLLAYAGYSLKYQTHKSWYSFVIATLVGSVYAYGFLMMVPSLYINYRLKSVAHMPGRAMMYKFLNTFIDDLFAFTIKMPMLHRLATLRDDVIFFVYLYQNYKYKVDYTRVNEFGQGGDEEGEDAKVAAKPLAASPNAASAEGKVAAVEAIKEGEAKASGVATGGEERRRK